MENDMDAAFILYKYYNYSIYDNYTDDDLMNTTSDTWVFGAPKDRIFLPSLLLLIAITAIVTNGLVIYTITAYRRMRTGFHLMLVNVAFSDLLFILCTVPVAAINHAKHDVLNDDTWLSVCKFVHYVIFVSVYVSVYTLVVACVFCYLSERGFSASPSTRFSRANAALASVAIWAAFLTSHLNLIVQKDPTIFEEPFVCSHIGQPSDQGKLQVLWVTFLVCAFLVPLIAVGVLSALVLHKQRKWRARQTEEAKAQSAADLRMKRELTLLLLVAMLIRCLCWLPIQLFVMVDVFAIAEMPAVYRTVEVLAVCVALAGSCTNPLVYAAVSSAFRQAVRETSVKFGCRVCCSDKQEDHASDMNETIMSIISDSSNYINYG